MSTGEEDRIARSVALEKTYVHDVYDHMSALQYPEHRNTTPWPKVKKFLNELEPGSIVCDVGCGNGKYLKVNPSIFKIGSDRCHKLTQIAKDDDNEVLLCDNLTLPFRDETFDAVLSIAVIHHFATKERRVGALRELARVLRIGGRLMITVWAMEQKDRKFETQDVLVQWHHPQFYRSPSLEFSTTATATSEEDFSVPYRMSQSHVSDDADSVFSRSSLQQDSRTGRSRLRLFQSLRSIKTSPSSSSLSSPNETCYSFVRKALQKLSRSSKKDKHRSRAWFLESWASFGKDDHLPATRYDPEGCEESADIQDLPIELRRMEKEEEPKKEKGSAMKSQEGGLTQKSKSLNDILSQAAIAPAPITRSHSGIVTVDGYKIKIKTSAPKVEMDTLKPKLVKQKKSICEEDFEYDEERDKATDMKRLVKELPIFKVSMEKPEKFNVLKQKSLTEDIMSADRLREKEKVRQNIQKQASLNEDLIYRRQRTIDSFKDTFLTNSSKKFQMLRSGLTSKLKNSTTNIEKVTGASLKSGFAKIFHGLTGGELVTISEPVPPQSPHHIPPSVRKSSSEDRGDEFPIERRCSHEENSDSSKDNSLQSDTSVDSEDSIISVIERIIPKPEQATSPTKLTSPGPHSPKLVLGGVLSHPSSPKISQVMQYPASKTKAFSLPASPRTIVFSPSIKQTFKIPPVAHIPPSNGNGSILTPNGKILTPNGTLLVRENSANGNSFKPLVSEGEPILKLSPMKQVTAARMKSFGDKEMLLLSEKLSVLSAKETEPRGDVCEGDESQKSDTEQPVASKEPVKKEESPSRVKSGVLKPPYALSKKPPISPYATYLAHQTRLQSYELFNPETEDIDTDSSGVSTPDSVGSVISVKLDSSNGTPNNEPAQPESDDIQLDDTTDSSISSLPPIPKPGTSSESKPIPYDRRDLHSTDITSNNQTQIATIFETVASVATSLESSVQIVLKGDPDTITPVEHLRPKREDSKEKLIKYPSLSKSPEDETWDRECRQYIVDLAENLSERLLAEIDRYKEQNINIEKEFFSFSAMDVEDPYLTKLSEDLSHVSKLTKELSEDLESKPEPDTEVETEQAESSEQVTEIKKMDSIEEISDVILDSKPDESDIDSKPDESDSSPREDKTKTPLLSDLSTDAESPGSITGWLDSRRNTIESGFWKDHEPVSAAPKQEEEPTKPVVKLEEQTVEVTEIEETHRLSITIQTTERVRKLSKSEITSQTRLSIESTDTVDVSERTVSSSEDSASKRDTTQTETSSGLSIESDLCELEKSSDTSKSTEYKHDTDMKYSGSQVSLLRPGESIESSDAGDISDRTGSVSDFSRQNTESRSVITQSSASLASWSDCSKDIRFADRRTARCDGRSSSEETNPRAMLTRQQAATQEPSEVKLESTDASLSGSTSQDSLTSESGGGSIMFHRYYHVFREGELDALIEEFVENLHIISSYYDHTNWCIIAEKVRVWTI
ncbi:mucin-4 isoform X2 [Planococcus citri]|uniref:mucin-4 isoform X2 n=1 Tax=Planococcus citri TaxID=170843 RepID=UPI0031F936B2